MSDSIYVESAYGSLIHKNDLQQSSIISSIVCVFKLKSLFWLLFQFVFFFLIFHTIYVTFRCITFNNWFGENYVVRMFWRIYTMVDRRETLLQTDTNRLIDIWYLILKWTTRNDSSSYVQWHIELSKSKHRNSVVYSEYRMQIERNTLQCEIDTGRLEWLVRFERNMAWNVGRRWTEISIEHEFIYHTNEVSSVAIENIHHSSHIKYWNKQIWWKRLRRKPSTHTACIHTKRITDNGKRTTTTIKHSSTL